MEIQLQKLTLDDLEELKKLSRKTFFDAFAEENSPENLQNYLDSAFNDTQLTTELNNPNSEFYFAKYEEKILGYLKINWGNAQNDLKESGAMELERIYVLESHQGKKVGKRLLTYAIEIATKRDMSFLWLGVWEKNESAIQFYKKFGFQVFDSHSFQMGDEAQMDYLMKLALD